MVHVAGTSPECINISLQKVFNGAFQHFPDTLLLRPVQGRTFGKHIDAHGGSSDYHTSWYSVLIPALPCNPDPQSRDTGDVIIEPFSIQSDRLCNRAVPIRDSDRIGTSVSSF